MFAIKSFDVDENFLFFPQNLIKNFNKEILAKSENKSFLIEYFQLTNTITCL